MVGIIQFYSNFYRTFCRHSGDPDRTLCLGLCYAASGLGLHCLPMSQKKDARLIWVKYR